MIFICLGTKRFSFDRLLIEMDRLIEENIIKEEVFAQIGSSDYTPRNYQFERFIDSEEYQRRVDESDIVLTHGGTGAIVKGLKSYKQVIAVPRKSENNEHSDDHQVQIVELFRSQNLIFAVYDIKDMHKKILEAKNHPITKRFKSEGNIIKIIEQFIEEN